MTGRAEMLAKLISLENGKALRDARGEVAYAAEFFRWNAEEAVRIVGDFGLAPVGANRIIVEYQPIGICVLITPWNFPAAMATRKIAPALAAGCTVVLKPATETPLTAYALAALYKEAGVPDGVVNVITTSSPGPVVSAMLADPRVRKLSFTGSTGVGRTLLAEASKTVLSCSMELGGNAPFLVFDDADRDIAVPEALIAKMRAGGQSCVAANRFLVQDGIADWFVSALAERMGATRVGPPTRSETDLGPLVDRRAVTKVHRLIDDAVGKGAIVVAQAPLPAGPGHYVAPTVLDHVPEAAAIMHEEVFGPVAAIHRFATEDDAITTANDTEHGLAAYVVTSNIDRDSRSRVASRLEWLR